MTSTNPFSVISLNGNGTIRGVTLAVPVDRARDLLPAGMELGEQSVTPKGTHPVILFFQDMFRAHMSIPSLLPSLTYHEHAVGIPFSYISPGGLTPGVPGPYYYLATVLVDNLAALAGGRLFWGFNKDLGTFNVTDDRYTVTSMAGERLTSFAWKTEGDGAYLPIVEYPHFDPVRQMLSQPFILNSPFGVGPFFMISDFDKKWDTAIVRPLRSVLEVDVEYVTGYQGGRYPATGWSPGIDKSVLGGFDLRADWRLSLAYPPLMNFRRPPA